MTLSAEILPAIETVVTIEAIKNPNLIGGTGNFVLWTTNGPNLLDENLIFGVIGIADEVQ